LRHSLNRYPTVYFHNKRPRRSRDIARRSGPGSLTAVAMTGPSSIHLDPEPKDAARRRDLVRLWTAVLSIRINAPGVDRQRLAVGTDLKDE
jgi:hypothetical protein